MTAAGLDVTLPPGAVVRVVGLGGVGQVVATCLVRFLTGLGQPVRVVLIDGDRFEAGNERRMDVPALYENKALALRDRLLEQCGGSAVTLLAVPQYLGAGNVADLLPSGGGEAVLLCVDNHATRKLVAGHVEGLDDACVISGGNDGVGPDASGVPRQGTGGNVQIHLRRGGRDLTPPLTKLHPEIASPRDRHPGDAGCDQLVASTPQILFANLFAASCILNAWWLHACGRLGYWELVFEIDKGRMGPLRAGAGGA